MSTNPSFVYHSGIYQGNINEGAPAGTIYSQQVQQMRPNQKSSPQPILTQKTPEANSNQIQTPTQLKIDFSQNMFRVQSIFKGNTQMLKSSGTRCVISIQNNKGALKDKKEHYQCQILNESYKVSDLSKKGFFQQKGKEIQEKVQQRIQVLIVKFEKILNQFEDEYERFKKDYQLQKINMDEGVTMNKIIEEPYKTQIYQAFLQIAKILLQYQGCENNVRSEFNSEMSFYQSIYQNLESLKRDIINRQKLQANIFDLKIDDFLKKTGFVPFDKLTSSQSPFQKNLFSRYDIEIKGHILNLRTSEWLSTNNIDFFVSYMLEKQMIRSQNKNDKGLLSQGNIEKTYYETVKSWSQAKKQLYSKAKITDFHSVSVPINLASTHWVSVTYNCKTKQVRYMDSANSLYGSRNCKAVEEGWKNFIIQDTNEPNLQITPKKDVGDQQSNGSDCGIFSCLNINKIVNEDNEPYTPEYYNSFRKRLYYLTLIIDNTKKGENLDLVLLEYLEGSTDEYRRIASKYF